MSLYETLDLDKAADPATIKRAENKPAEAGKSEPVDVRLAEANPKPWTPPPLIPTPAPEPYSTPRP